jgi:hypothetical protein
VAPVLSYLGCAPQSAGMVGDLTHAFLALALQTGALSTLQTLADIAQKSAATIAIVGTAGWAYFKFVRGRTFRRRLELTISGEVRRNPGIVYLLTNSTVKNIGLSQFEIDHEKSGLRVMTYASEGAVTEARLVEWSPLSTWAVLEGKEALEPGEPAAEELLIEIPDKDFLAFRLQLWVSSTHDESWEVTAVVNLEPAGDNEDGGGIVEGG